MSRADFLSAIRAYRAAEDAATRASIAGRPQSRSLVVFARLGVGASLIAADALDRAAEFFEETATLARALPDVRLEIEARRLAAYRHQRTSEPQKAWDAAFEAFAVLVRTPVEARPLAASRELGRTLLHLT